MLKINNRKEPEFWSKYIKNHQKSRYADLENTEEGRAIRAALREYLVKSQYYVCAYCCKRISDENAINEHIKPQRVPVYSGLSMRFDNLIASCAYKTGEKTCGTAKENKYDEFLFVSPLQEDCLNHFRFYPNGTIEGTTKQGKYTVELLNLNSYKLRNARAANYKAYENCRATEVASICLKPDENGYLLPFSDIIRYFYEKGYFEDR